MQVQDNQNTQVQNERVSQIGLRENLLGKNNLLKICRHDPKSNHIVKERLLVLSIEFQIKLYH